MLARPTGYNKGRRRRCIIYVYYDRMAADLIFIRVPIYPGLGVGGGGGGGPVQGGEVGRSIRPAPYKQQVHS
jgi:hypothetical protein